MPATDDKDIRPPFADEETISPRDPEAADDPAAADTSEIARRLSVLGKLIIPPTAPR